MISVGTLPGMNILKEVPTHTITRLLSGNFPVTVLLKLRANIAHHRTHVANTKPRSCLVRGKSLACGEVVDDLSLLGESVARHSVESPWVLGF